VPSLSRALWPKLSEQESRAHRRQPRCAVDADQRAR